jgi:hypothetical protein
MSRMPHPIRAEEDEPEDFRDYHARKMIERALAAEASV